jgi:iron complex transport system ATP-binding protein
VTAVVLDDVSVSYEAEPVVRSINLSVGSGEWLAFIGPNGAGKTTVLRAIAGLARHSGQITVGGDPVTALRGKELARRITMVRQDPEMPAGMTVTHYVLLGRTPHLSYFAREGARDRRVVADVLERLSLGPLAERPMAHLSGGERQRAAIARALAQQAPILLLDEPTSSLDVGRQQEVLELVDALRTEEGLTVIAAMHDLTLASQYADRLALVVAGQLIHCGSAKAVLTEQAIAHHYQAHVRIMPLPVVGRAVVPVRSGSEPTTEETTS